MSMTFQQWILFCLITLLVAPLGRLLRPASPGQLAPDQTQMETAAAIVGATSETKANLALLGDKSFLINPQKNAFIMYGVQGRSWVAMGDPVGPQDDWPEGWSDLPLPDKVLFYSEAEAAEVQAEAIETWRNALSQ